MKKWILLTMGLLLVLPTPTPAQPEEVKIGYLGYLSGPGAVWGIPMSRGVDIVTEDINTSGGWWDKRGFNIGGRTYIWNSIIEDNGFSPDVAIKATNKLIYRDKVKFIHTGGGAVCKAIAPITREANVLFMSHGAVGKEICNPDFPLIFKIDPMPPDVNAADLYKAMVDREGIKSIAILTPNDESGKSWPVGAVPAAKNLGIRVAIQEHYERGITDFFPLLTRVLAAKPDMIDLTYGPVPIQAAMVKQAWQLGYRGKWLLYGAKPDDVVPITGKEPVENAYDWEYLAEPVTDFQRWFVKEYTWRYGGEWSPLAMYHASSMYGLTLAIESAQSLDVFKVADAFEDLVWQNHHGPHHFSGEINYGVKRVGLFPSPVAQIKDGKAVHSFMLPAPEKY